MYMIHFYLLCNRIKKKNSLIQTDIWRHLFWNPSAFAELVKERKLQKGYNVEGKDMLILRDKKRN